MGAGSDHESNLASKHGPTCDATGHVQAEEDASAIQRKQAEGALRRLEWLLTKGVAARSPQQGQTADYQPPYGNLGELNTCQVLRNSVGGDVLDDIVGEYLDLLETSAAVYEKNGDYALGLFTSGWCRFLDRSSRNLCNTDDNREALTSGKWHCHESCWTEASKVSIETGQPVDIECRGGIRLFAVPIWAGEEIVGAINVGYGDPPQDPVKLQEIADRYGVSVDELLKQAQAYEARPSFIIDIAKSRLPSSARLIGEITQRWRAEEALQRSEALLQETQRIAKVGGWELDLETQRLIWTEEVYRIHEVPFDFEPDLESALAFYVPEDRAILEQAIQQAAKTGEPWNLELQSTTAGGKHLWVRTVGKAAFRDEEVVELWGTFQDITERKQAREALQEAHYELELRVHELSTLLDISNTVALTLDLEPLLALILDRLRDVVEYDGATIYRLEADVLSALIHRGPIPQQEVLQLQMPVDRASRAHRLLLGQQPVIIPDVRGDTCLARAFREVAGERSGTLFHHVRSWLGVPLTVKDRVVGLLTLQSGKTGQFASRQAELAVAFANQAAVAMETTRLYEQAQQLAVVEERQRLARDLHDAVSQTLFSASLAAEVLPRLWERNQDDGRRCLHEVRLLTRGALAEMRTLLLELRPAALIQTELADLLNQLAEAATSRSRIPVTVTAARPCPLPAEVQVALYRVAQEALNNVAKHAAASQVRVGLTLTPHPSPLEGRAEGRPRARVGLSFVDDGQGFDPACVGADRHGLNIMRERAAAVGATFWIDSQVGRGTEVHVTWPGEELP